MSDNKEKQSEESLANVEVALTRTEQFIEKNQKVITIGALAIVVAIAAFWSISKFYFEPLENKAQTEMFNAQFYFEKDSFNLALNGDESNSGFLNIIDEYGSTKAGKLARYYAGVCYLNLGQFDEAIASLSSFSSDNNQINSLAKGLVGDAQLEKGNSKEAVAAYKKAIDCADKLTAPIYLMKLGVLYESMGDAASATAAYQQLKDNYKTSSQARFIDKYIERAGAAK